MLYILFMGGLKMKKDFAVIGLGRFGGSICRELSKEGKQVLAIDRDEQRVNKYKDIAYHAVILDATDEDSLKEIGIQNFEHVIVAIGENIQASILTTVILTDLRVEQVTVKAQNDYHEKILRKLGVEDVVHPERDMGRRIAQHIISDNILDYLDLSDDHSIVEVRAGKKMIGKSLLQLNIRAKYGCNVVAVKRGENINASPSPDYIFSKDDILLVIGNNLDIKHFEKQLIID